MYFLSEPFNKTSKSAKENNIDPDNYDAVVEFFKSNLDDIEYRACKDKFNNILIRNQIDQYYYLQKINLLNRLLLQLQEYNFYTIVLIRKNVIETALSFVLAWTTNNWDTFNYDETANFMINKKDVGKRLENVLQCLGWLLKNEFQIKYDKVIMYEDLPQQPEKAYEYLNLKDTRDEKINLEKFIPKKAPDKKKVVANYDEIFEYCNDIIARKQFSNMSFKDGTLDNMKLNIQ
tara:strand:- start:42 stop:740 length:699 start_codon:yes stop_codon:yes gene_type:complete